MLALLCIINKLCKSWFQLVVKRFNDSDLDSQDKLEHLSSLSPGRPKEKKKKILMSFYLHTRYNNLADLCVFIYEFILFLQSTQKNVDRIHLMIS